MRSQGFRESVLWQEQVEPVVVERAELPAEVDVAIVGAGYCGLMAARELARRGHHTLVVEADELGWGASTRNAGMVIPELKAGPAALAARYGPLGARLHACVEEAFDLVEGLVSGGSDVAKAGGVRSVGPVQLPPSQQLVDCDYVRSGQLYCAHDPSLRDALVAMAAEHRDRLGDTGARFVEGDELAAEIGSEAYPFAVVLGRTGGLHPARYHAGLLRLALSAGTELQAATRALGFDAEGDGMRLYTSRGEVRCRDLILATNATADGVAPRLRRRVLPVGSFMVATEPLGPELAGSLLPRGRMAFDSKTFLFYWRVTPDGRLVFGGRRHLGATTLGEAAGFLESALVRVYPQLAGVAIDRVWGGHVAMTFDRLPHVGRIGRAWYATGCNGSGVAVNTWMGAALAAVLAGEAAAPPFAELPHPRIPLHRVRRAYLGLVGAWLRRGDRSFWRRTDRRAVSA